MKNLNNTLEKISIKMHNRTGYSILHMVLEANDDFELRGKYRNNFFIYNSEEWQFFIELIEEACK